jgi:hypothetical protein
MMQPTFLPWLGYFALIRSSDIFVFLDDFQFVRRSFHQRNRFFVSKEKVDWITLPVSHVGVQNISIRDVMIDYDAFDLNKFYKKIKMTYGKAIFYKQAEGLICDILNLKIPYLAELNMRLIVEICNYLDIKVRFEKSSDMIKGGVRSDKLISILTQVNADCYLSARGSKEYMFEDQFTDKFNGKVRFQEFTCLEYSQINSKNFVPYLSIVDFLFQLSSDEILNLIELGSDFSD